MTTYHKETVEATLKTPQGRQITAQVPTGRMSVRELIKNIFGEENTVPSSVFSKNGKENTFMVDDSITALRDQVEVFDDIYIEVTTNASGA